MKGEPKWGRNGLLQLTWVYDELFVTPEIWSGVFEPAGVACRPVLSSKGVELKTVVQLVIEEAVGVATEGLMFVRCEHCGRTKYLPPTRGAFPGLREVPTAAMAWTAEHFGSGGQGDRRILVRHDLARSLTTAGARGQVLRPVTGTI